MSEPRLTSQAFHAEVEALLLEIEDSLGNAHPVVDSQISNGVLSFTLANGHHIIISRQTPLQEIWLALKSGAYHFAYDSETNKWCTKQGEVLMPMIQQAIQAAQ